MTSDKRRTLYMIRSPPDEPTLQPRRRHALVVEVGRQLPTLYLTEDRHQTRSQVGEGRWV